MGRGRNECKLNNCCEDKAKNVFDFKVQYVDNVPVQTACSTIHLTSFGTGFFKTENAVDFSFIFAHFDYADHVTIFAVILIAIIMFLITLIWAQIHDMRDVDKVGILLIICKTTSNINFAAKTSLDV